MATGGKCTGRVGRFLPRTGHPLPADTAKTEKHTENVSGSAKRVSVNPILMVVFFEILLYNIKVNEFAIFRGFPRL